MATEKFANNASTTLLGNGGSITSGATSLIVADASTFPASGQFRILIGTELILVGAVSGNTFSSLTRGVESTTPASHNDGDAVTHILTASSLIQAITDRNKILQVVATQSGALQTFATNIPGDDTIPQNTEGTEITALATTITPLSSTSKLRVDVVVVATSTAGWVLGALFRDSGADAIGAYFHYENISTSAKPVNFTTVVNSGSTSSTTFKVRLGAHSAEGTPTLTINGAGGSRLFGGVMSSSMVITEYEP